MSAAHKPIEGYVLGNSSQEQERLKLQGRFLEKLTEQFLLSAGLEPGMGVLDLGCGMGDVSLLAARLLGPSGHVTAIDRDSVVIEKARERAREEGYGAHIKFIRTELLDFHAERSFDAVVGRYVLFFQSDPVAAIAHAAKQVRPQGIVVFHELDLTNRIRNCPNGTLFDRMWALIAETERRAGVWVDLGSHLTHLFLDAGLPWPMIKAEVPVGGEPNSFVYRWVTETLRSLLPRIEQFGLASAGELDLDTLVARMEAEASTFHTQLMGPLQFGAWARNPQPAGHQPRRNDLSMQKTKPAPSEQSVSNAERGAAKELALATPPGFDYFTYNSVRQQLRRNGVSEHSVKPAPHEQILSIVQGFWQARALATATELGLPELLAKGPLHIDELARRAKTDASALFRLLRALESIGIFTQDSPRVFSNTATSECLRKDVPGSQWPTVVHCLSKGSGPFEGWGELEYAVRTGRPSLQKAYGYDFWELLRRNPQASTAMNGAMRSASAAMTPVITAAYNWNQFPVIADIGGGIGTQLVSILEASPAAKGILFDKPHLRGESMSHDRMDVISGDFFKSLPTGADAYLARFILHDWSDAEAGAILRSLHRAMKPNARLIVIEAVIPEGPTFNFGKWTDLQMLVCVGGRERTEMEYRALLAAAGFALQEVVATASPLRLLVAKPM